MKERKEFTFRIYARERASSSFHALEPFPTLSSFRLAWPVLIVLMVYNT